MIDEIDPILPTQGTVATKVNDSTSITAEPDRAWVAHLQEAITSGLERRNENSKNTASNDDHEAKGHLRHPGADLPAPDEDAAHDADEKLSGESERIGTGNWDDDVPFGDHVGFL